MLLIAAAVLALVGEATASLCLAVAGVLSAIPTALAAAASPRPGLVWQGRYAEPWRAQHSPGETVDEDSAEDESRR